MTGGFFKAGCLNNSNSGGVGIPRAQPFQGRTSPPRSLMDNSDCWTPKVKNFKPKIPMGTSWLSSWWCFTNPFEKYAQVKLDHEFPQGSVGVKIKKHLKFRHLAVPLYPGFFVLILEPKSWWPFCWFQVRPCFERLAGWSSKIGHQRVPGTQKTLEICQVGEIICNLLPSLFLETFTYFVRNFSEM